jgi:CelD/BcsL family acetyltransferase involved in cellulose biosynthesis
MPSYAPDMSLATGRVAVTASAKASHLTVREVTSVHDLPLIEDAWHQVHAAMGSGGIFGSWQWTSTVARHYAKGRRLRVALIECDGDIVGLAPLGYRRYMGVNTLALLGGGLADYSIADYQDILLKSGTEREALAALVEHIASRPWDLLWLQEVPPESPVLAHLPQLAAERGWCLEYGPPSDVHRVDLPATWDDYVASLSSSWRKEIRGKLRRLETEHGATFERIERADEVDGAMEALFDLHTQRWNAVGQPGIFASEQARAFYKDLARAMHAAGSLYLSRLTTASGEVAGAGFGFDHGGTRYAYTYGYKAGPEWDKASLGLMLDCFCIQNAIELGLTKVDLMRGEGEYKKRYGAVAADNVEVKIYRSRAAFLRAAAYRGLRTTAKRLLKRQ